MQNGELRELFELRNLVYIWNQYNKEFNQKNKKIGPYLFFVWFYWFDL